MTQRLSSLPLLFALLGVALLGFAGGPARADEPDQETYYYPKLTSSEVFVSRAKVLNDSTRQRRLGFINGLAQQLNALPYPPQFIIFAKGDDAEKLIVIGMQDDGVNSIYRARAVFAQLTTMARASALFKDLAVEELFTFYDLARMLGFARITVSDGKNFSHQVTLQ
jgi:hypothetical protein